MRLNRVGMVFLGFGALALGNAGSLAAQVPAGATARCGDGTYSTSKSNSGTCSHHGGVAEWMAGAAALPEPAPGRTPSMLQSLLRTLVIAEEVYFADSISYTQDLARLRFNVPPGVTVSVKAGSDSYRAAAEHSSGVTCYIFFGTRAAVAGQEEGKPWCDQ